MCSLARLGRLSGDYTVYPAMRGRRLDKERKVNYYMKGSPCQDAPVTAHQNRIRCLRILFVTEPRKAGGALYEALS